MPQPVAIVSVTNDLTTDQRVNRTCLTLVRSGYDVLLVGRHLRNSKALTPRTYRTHRMRLLFDKGAFFYAEYNTRLFLFLLLQPKTLLFSNDLDTLPANYLAWRVAHLFGLKARDAAPHLVHDCHEYFRGVPELVGRNRITRVWKWIEDLIFPRLPHVMAVNRSVADLYRREYGNTIAVVRNVPLRRISHEPASRESLGIRPEQKVILYQGAINVDRGIEEVIEAMTHLKQDAVLLVAGTGDCFEQVRTLIGTLNAGNRVKLLGQVPFDRLQSITLLADLGLSIEKDVSLNYHFALPNKFLDYIQAEVPVLVSPFPEMKAIVDRYEVGTFLQSHDPKEMASQLDSLLSDPTRLAHYKANCRKAAEALCWENEEQVLTGLLKQTGTNIKT